MSAPEYTLRIAHACELFWPSQGGAENHIAYVARELHRRGHAVDVITGALPFQPSVEDHSWGFRIMRLDYRGLLARHVYTGRSGIKRQLLWIACLMRYLERNGSSYDVIHCHMVPSLVAAVFAGQSRRLIWTCHGSYHEVNYSLLPYPMAVFYDLAERLAIRLPYQRCITVSARLKRLLCEEFFAPQRRLVSIVNGVDTDLFGPMPVAKPGHWPAGFHILFAGRLTVYKGVDTLIRAIPSVLTHRPDARLLVYGNGPERQNLEELRDSLGLNALVSFFDMVTHDKVPEVLCAADVIVFPSRMEGNPLSVAEGMACAKPVITCPVGGIPETFPRDALVYSKPGDVESLVEALCNVLVKMTSQERTELGRRAHRYVAAHLTWGGVTDELEKLYREILT